MITVMVACAQLPRQRVLVQVKNMYTEGVEDLVVVESKAGRWRVAETLWNAGGGGHHRFACFPEVEVEQNLLKHASTMQIVVPCIVAEIQLQQLRDAERCARVLEFEGKGDLRRVPAVNDDGLALCLRDEVDDGVRGVTFLEKRMGNAGDLILAIIVHAGDVVFVGLTVEDGMVVAGGRDANERCMSEEGLQGKTQV